MNALLLLAGLAAAPVPDVLAKPVDIQCQDHATYIGGIDRRYALRIGGPAEKTWKYDFEMVPGLEKVSMAGTYEIVDGLAIFTGTVNGKEEVRFGLNFGFLAGEVEFNGFFPAGQSLHYQRRWYRKVDGAWQPAKEVILTTPVRALGGGINQIEFKGERIVWDQSGQPQRQKIDVKIPYRGQGEYFGVHQGQAGLPDAIPQTIVPHKGAWLFGMPRGPDGFLRGFRPDLRHGQ